MSDFVLNDEDVGQITIIAIGPDVAVILGIDELSRDPHREPALRTLPSKRNQRRGASRLPHLHVLPL